MKFEGTYTALVTPFSGGQVDSNAYAKLLSRQAEAGVAGVVPCGCTGEAATLSARERQQLLETALTRVGDRVQVVAGTGTNSTESSIRLTREAEVAGAHAAMLITPYYNKPSQAGLLDHYRRIGDATTLPLILYNVPGRTAVTLSAETVAVLHKTGRYAAIKEAGGHVDTVSDIRSRSDITVLSGDDALAVPMLSLGARGVVSVVSNLLPAEVVSMVQQALAGDFTAAAAIHFRLLPIMRAAFIESNPSPIKALLAARGLIVEELRAPLAPVSEASRVRIARAWAQFNEAGGE